MLKRSIGFLLAASATLLISQVLLSGWLRDLVDNANNFISILIGGLRFDLSLIRSTACLPSDSELVMNRRPAIGQTVILESVRYKAALYKQGAELPQGLPLNLVLTGKELLGVQYLEGGMGGTGLPLGIS